MQRTLIICMSLWLSLSIISAQSTCSVLDELITLALDICSETTPDRLCIAQGDASATVDNQDNNLSSDDLMQQSLAEIASLETKAADDVTPILWLALNREDVPLSIIVLGEVSLENTAPRTEITVSATRNVNLRATPSRDASVIGSLTIRESYTAIGRVSDNTWIQIRLEDGRIGWASAQFFTTRQGYEQLQAITPTTPPYLPMQSINLQVDDCATVLVIAQQLADEAIIFGINGAQLTINGIVALRIADDTLSITSIIGEHRVNAFGFETDLTPNQQTTIALSTTGSIAGIPSETEEITSFVSDEVYVLLEDVLSNKNRTE